MAVFRPTIMIEHITDIQVELLQKHHWKGLLLDVDNTMTTHGHPVPAVGVTEWVKTMKQNGIQLMIVSNNSSERVKPFAELLDIPFVSRGCKPLPKGVHIAMERMGLRQDQVAIVGDQLFTDIFGGNLAGISSILVTPYEMEEGPLFRFKRQLERPFLNRYREH